MINAFDVAGMGMENIFDTPIPSRVNNYRNIESMSVKINTLYAELNEKDRILRHVQETVRQQQDTIRRNRDTISSLEKEKEQLLTTLSISRGNGISDGESSRKMEAMKAENTRLSSELQICYDQIKRFQKKLYSVQSYASQIAALSSANLTDER